MKQAIDRCIDMTIIIQASYRQSREIVKKGRIIMIEIV